MGKVFARILQDRLQVVTESVLPESQCGFRKGRGCVDMIFTAKQLVEKSREHDDPLYSLFVDLKKAYDSVPRKALWCVLEKYGVPPTMVSVIRFFHQDMTAVVRVGNDLTEDIEVTNGLRQGCTLAPTLFNLYFSAVVACWKARCPQAGVTVRYRNERKLVGDRTAKSRLLEINMTESQFADDVAAYAVTREALEQVAAEFDNTAANWGLTVSLEKTKLLTLGKQLKPEDNLSIQLNGVEIATVKEFSYLGSSITRDVEVRGEVSMRLGRASKAFACLRSAIFHNKQLSMATKHEVYNAVVLPTLLYGAEMWTVKADSVRRMRGFHNHCIRSMLGVSRLQQWTEKISSRELAETIGMTESIAEILRRHRLRWLGHVARMEDSRMPSNSCLESLRDHDPNMAPREDGGTWWRQIPSCWARSGLVWSGTGQERVGRGLQTVPCL